MPTIRPETLDAVVDQVLQAAGAPADHARVVAEHLVDANLAGHDSHGVQRIPQYVDAVDGGSLIPTENPVIVDETPALVQIDGKWTFGQVIATYGTELAIAKAREVGVGLVTMYNEGHTGRLGTYPEMAARAGMACALWDGVIGSNRATQAPLGGQGRLIGANPIAMGFPGVENDPIILDYASSMSAAGKVRFAYAQGKKMPGDWIQDADGNPTNDPQAFYDGGALRPMGVPDVGHKGYALAFMVGLMGLMASMRSDEQFPSGVRWGTAILVMDISRFGPLDDFRAQVDQAVEFVKGDHTDTVQYPGEYERRSRQQRANGIDVPDKTWQSILAYVDRFELRSKLPELP